VGHHRLNVYVGEAAGYVITDPSDPLFGPGAPYETSLGLGIPLIIQDRTFVPQDAQLYNQYDANGNVLSYGRTRPGMLLAGAAMATSGTTMCTCPPRTLATRAA